MSSSFGFSRHFSAILLTASLLACSRAPESAPPITAASEAAERKAAAAELLELGLQFARGGDSVRGEQYLAAALDSGADPNVALLPLLKLCIKAGRFEAAAQYAESYAKDVAAKRDVEMLTGGLYITLDRTDKAIVYFERVVKKYPEHAMAHFLLARLLRDEGRDLERADQHFRAYLKLVPDGQYATEARESLLKRVDETEQLPEISAVDP
jgi:tetratricopeptide (TPR) repeat protein